jgi:hypothetical protein
VVVPECEQADTNDSHLEMRGEAEGHDLRTNFVFVAWASFWSGYGAVFRKAFLSTETPVARLLVTVGAGHLRSRK